MTITLRAPFASKSSWTQKSARNVKQLFVQIVLKNGKKRKTCVHYYVRNPSIKIYTDLWKICSSSVDFTAQWKSANITLTNIRHLFKIRNKSILSRLDYHMIKQLSTKKFVILDATTVKWSVARKYMDMNLPNTKKFAKIMKKSA